MSSSAGQSKIRVDAYDKAAGRAKFTDDLCGRRALATRLVHARIAHGMVKSIDTAAAEKMIDAIAARKNVTFLKLILQLSVKHSRNIVYFPSG